MLVSGGGHGSAGLTWAMSVASRAGPPTIRGLVVVVARLTVVVVRRVVVVLGGRRVVVVAGLVVVGPALVVVACGTVVVDPGLTVVVEPPGNVPNVVDDAGGGQSTAGRAVADVAPA